MKDYQPPFVPPPHHPRLLVNAGELEKIRANLKTGINAAVWQGVCDTAKIPLRLIADSIYSAETVSALGQKAFYHLITGERAAGREAIEQMLIYLEGLRFDRKQDETRPIGEVIYTASLIYDWCYGLLDDDERTLLRRKMLALAETMEVGWPPFKESVVLGHANEAQISRDLLSMAIAVYDEDPEPYRYVSYLMLERFEPSKRFLYRSGRHDQGTDYGAYRYMWDLFAAIQFRRTFGYEILPPEAAQVPFHWFYQRLPDNRFMVEGDVNWSWSGTYLGNPRMLLSAISLWRDAELKAELRRYNEAMDFPEDPVFFLLVNDPALMPRDHRDGLPLCKIYRDPLPGMAIRTGWNFSRLSDDVVVTLNGADYHYRNHQHLDMGAFQIYYRGNLAADLGQYGSYGSDFDWNFSKSSVSHSAMRFRDPEQKNYLMGPKFTANTGTQEITGWWPAGSLEEQTCGTQYRNGQTLSNFCGPVPENPLYAVFESDLAMLYPGRVKSYTRSFVHLNLGLPGTPAALIVLDRFEKAAERVEPIFQLTSIAAPQPDEDNLEITVSPYCRTGKLTVQTLLPAGAQKQILTGKEVHTLDGTYFPPPFPAAPEANGCRTEITGAGNTFLHLLQIQDGEAAPLPVEYAEYENRISLSIADRLINFGNALHPTDDAVIFRVAKPATQVLLLNLKPGIWELAAIGKCNVADCFFAVLEPGEYQLKKVENSDIADLPAPVFYPPARPAAPANMVFIDGKLRPDLKLTGDAMLPLTAMLKDFQPRVTLPQSQETVPAVLAAGIFGMSLDYDQNSNSVFLETIQKPGDIFQVEAREDAKTFWNMASTGEIEWSAFGRNIPLKVQFIHTKKLRAIAIRWPRGKGRQYSLRIELSADGNHFTPVFDGWTKGGSDDFERIEFPPQKAQTVRFLFRGNHVGPWNHISGLKFEEK